MRARLQLLGEPAITLGRAAARSRQATVHNGPFVLAELLVQPRGLIVNRRGPQVGLGRALERRARAICLLERAVGRLLRWIRAALAEFLRALTSGLGATYGFGRPLRCRGPACPRTLTDFSEGRPPAVHAELSGDCDGSAVTACPSGASRPSTAISRMTP